MSARLIRALQRGGCAVEQSSGHWTVWRGKDRRGREIGQLRCADVELLRLQGDLAQLAGADDGRLIWVGKVDPLENRRISASAISKDEIHAPAKRRPLLQRLLEVLPKPSERRRLARAARDFSEDKARQYAGAAGRGMNWRDISVGGRIDGGRGPSGQDTRIGYAQASARRLDHLCKLLNPDDMQLLERLVIELCTRGAIAGWLGIPPKQAELRALRVLCNLADIYDQQLKQPMRVTPRPT